MRAEHTWSMLDPRPVLLYLKEHDDYIVYWNGIAMTHSQAMNMALETIGIYPTPEMKSVMEVQYRKLYYSGAFGTRNWDHTVESGELYGMIKKWMKDHLNAHVKNGDPKNILSWFDYSKARTHDGEPS